MRLFCIKPDDTNWGIRYKYQIDASHKWGLPGVNCDVCGNTWAMTGIIYPTIDLSSLPNSSRFLNVSPVLVAEYKSLSSYISNLFPSIPFLPPGTDLGPLVGKAWGKFGDFAWPNSWNMLMQKTTYEVLVSRGVLLPAQGLTPELVFRAKFPPDLIEPEIHPSARLAKTAFIPINSSPCPSCRRNSHKLQRIVVDVSSIPTNYDLFRSRDHPTHILATEKFIEEVKALQLSDISFFEVNVE